VSVTDSYAVLGHLLDQAHTDRVRFWEVADNYVGGQVDPNMGAWRARRTLNLLAQAVGQMSEVSEQTWSTHTMMQTNGRSGDVEIQLWALIQHVHNNPEAQS